MLSTYWALRGISRQHCRRAPAERGGPDDRLQFAVRVQAEAAAVASDTGLLEAAERRFVVALRSVDADVAGPELPRDAHRPRRVLREHIVVQTELRPVGERDSLVLVVERHDDHHGP